ncbi:MAG: DNA translocase FtsK, partial [Armatimonadetes bacterium]|nr:DNA translocase FtsK [Armatimonadota bacterium]
MTHHRAQGRRKSQAAGSRAPGPEPLLSLLPAQEASASTPGDRAETETQRTRLEEVLASLGIRARVRAGPRGAVVTRFEVEPERGLRHGRLLRLADDLALALGAIHVRMEAPVPGQAAVAIEVPNPRRREVTLRSILESEAYRQHDSPLAVPLGEDVAGGAVVADLRRLPHLLIAGATNSGKSVCLHSIIVSLLLRARPEEVKLVLIDPKRVELMAYDGVPHLLTPIVHTVAWAAEVLRELIRRMEQRYDLLAGRRVVNIGEYNELAARPKEQADDEFEPLPYIVVVIDELADLMMQARAEFELSVCRLAQLGRAAGIHVIIATQRPSVNVLTGAIKANIPSRIALAVASPHDSRAILGTAGAERLIGRGDLLYQPIDAGHPRRVQGAYVSPRGMQAIVEQLRQGGPHAHEITPETLEGAERRAADTAETDALYAAAVAAVVLAGEASVSMLQRRFKIGYARAARLVDSLEAAGIVGPPDGARARQVLVPRDAPAVGARPDPARARP